MSKSPSFDLDAIARKDPATRTNAEQLALARAKRRPMTPEEGSRVRGFRKGGRKKKAPDL